MNIEYKLPKGITGFTSLEDFFEIPEIKNEDVEGLFKEYIKNNLEYKLVGIQESNESNNYFTVILINIYKNEKYFLLFNNHFPFYSLLKENISWCERSYKDLEDYKLISFLEKKGFKFLTKSFLHKKIEKSKLRELGKSELEQIEYWDCISYGEIVFNNFD
ncbi:hypothetical protein [Tenacibaculum maritimum]|uniref:hypothetical protein n=1 Tax=Tenacibaculum maritimum TaxID=107401 RepID=UPI001E2EA07E|nr:hypothetical protein [Tenacibaculum maritimum]MCD9612160.1 hypothetical protein [Tenacibaculum maritimum]